MVKGSKLTVKVPIKGVLSKQAYMPLQNTYTYIFLNNGTLFYQREIHSVIF